MHARMALALLAGFFMGCGSSDTPLNFNGEYRGQSTNGANNCPGQWPPGQVADGEIIVTQNGNDVLFQAQGATSIIFLVTFGMTSFSGRVTGSHAEAALVGSTEGREGTCSFTWKGTLSAELDGDTLTGTLTSTPVTNGDADCNTQKVTGCSRVTNFSYTRLPR
jgi:hypothetical protein